MHALFRRFVEEDQAQDLIEYTLLLAMICLASAAMFIGGGNSVSGIWSVANSRLGAANSTVS